MEVRLLLAFLLMGVVMFAFQYLFPQPPPAAPRSKPPPRRETERPPPASAAHPPPAAHRRDPRRSAVAEARTAAASPRATPQAREPPLVIETDLYKIALSNQGGNVRSWQLKKWPRATTISRSNWSIPRRAWTIPFSLHFPGAKPAANVNWAWYKQTVDPDGLGVTYEYSDGHVNVRKVLRFQKNSYLSTVSTEVTLDGKPLPHMIEWRGGFGDLTVSDAQRQPAHAVLRRRQ